MQAAPASRSDQAERLTQDRRRQRAPAGESSTPCWTCRRSKPASSSSKEAPAVSSATVFANVGLACYTTRAQAKNPEAACKSSRVTTDRDRNVLGRRHALAAGPCSTTPPTPSSSHPITAHVTMLHTCIAASHKPPELQVRFEVEDTGIGIAPERRGAQAVHAPSSKPTTPSTRQYGGTGLGLAITKKLAAADGWRSADCHQRARARAVRFWFTARLRRAGPTKAAAATPVDQ
jgi:hypothetical protein